MKAWFLNSKQLLILSWNTFQKLNSHMLKKAIFAVSAQN